ncbi:Mlc [Mucinivorans hirudinis]|uniref:Mlc n=1 Tax=Mucinivorans hirudinis TaxID=1433126 RepID=A0A060RCP5_9BACT|nr:Mlc [Mucinivorans hirudinis]
MEEGKKMSSIKFAILNAITISGGELSIADISRHTDTSIPTVTKFIGELIDEGYVVDNGKNRLNNGRRPSIYGFNPDKGTFVGVDLAKDVVRICSMNFRGDMAEVESHQFETVNTTESVEALCDLIRGYIGRHSLEWDKVLAVSLSMGGRVDSRSGFSHTMYSFGELPVVEIMSGALGGVNVYVENDSRAMLYGEYLCGSGREEQTVVFANLSWGFGLGIIIDGKLFYGKSGFSGEYGHIPMTDNEIICQCGKIGCVETDVSGWATRRKIIEKLKDGRVSILSEKFAKTGDVTLNDILDAAQVEDTLAIEVIETVGESLGKALSGVINIFNPEIIIIGGCMMPVKEYFMLPMRQAIQKYSLRLVSRDTVIRTSALGDNAAVYGSCLFARSKMLGIV